MPTPDELAEIGAVANEISAGMFLRKEQGGNWREYLNERLQLLPPELRVPVETLIFTGAAMERSDMPRDVIETRFFVLGAVLLVLTLSAAGYGFWNGVLTPDQRALLRWALALSSGFLGAGLIGSATARMRFALPGQRLVISATSGFALALIVYFWHPFRAPPGIAEATPPATPQVGSSTGQPVPPAKEGLPAVNR
jgi:hypothetical protein